MKGLKTSGTRIVPSPKKLNVELRNVRRKERFTILFLNKKIYQLPQLSFIYKYSLHFIVPIATKSVLSTSPTAL